MTEQTFAVTGVPDEKKGERLVVLHTLTEDKLKPAAGKTFGLRPAQLVETTPGPVFSR